MLEGGETTTQDGARVELREPELHFVSETFAHYLYKIALIIQQLHANSGEPQGHILKLNVCDSSGKPTSADLRSGDPFWHFEEKLYGLTDTEDKICDEVDTARRDVNRLGLLLTVG
jgi:hypothetical protein